MKDSFAIIAMGEQWTITKENVNKDINGLSPIRYCISQDGDIETAIALGADLFSRDRYTLNALSMAIWRRNEKAVCVLLEHGAPFVPINFPVRLSKYGMCMLADYNIQILETSVLIYMRERHMEFTATCIALLRFHGGWYRDAADMVVKHLWSMRWNE